MKDECVLTALLRSYITYTYGNQLGKNKTDLIESM